MAAGAVDRFFEAPQTPEDPPLWLQRHTGPISEIRPSAHACGELIDELDLLHSGDDVADAGCGFGVMANVLADRFGRSGTYLGFDTHSIRWAQRFLARSDSRLRFVLVGSEPSNPVWPAASESVDLVLAKSLFTHLTSDASRRALAEISRILKPAGKALVTAFLYEDDRSPGALLPYPGEGSPVRWRWKHRPEAIVAYERVFFSDLITAAGLHVDLFRPGFWPRADRLNAQDVLVLSKAPKA